MTAIWVTPAYANIQNQGASVPYHYYWPFNFEQIDRRLLDGTRLPNSVDMSTFGTFVDLCEAKGMKIVLDMVVNHSG
jgi:glycosidase